MSDPLQSAPLGHRDRPGQVSGLQGQAPSDTTEPGPRIACKELADMYSANLKGPKHSEAQRIGREDVDESFGPASVVLRGYGRRVGAGTWSDLLSGLTPHLGCLETGPSPGSRSFRHPPALPVRSAWPGQEAGVSQIGGQRVRAIPQPQRKGTAMTILEDTRVITGGVDTHADMHVAAALDPLGGLLGGAGVPGYRGRVRRSARLAVRVRGPRPGRC
jgi:hypothetical protein